MKIAHRAGVAKEERAEAILTARFALASKTMIFAPFLIPRLMLLFAGTFVRINTFGMFLHLIFTVLLPVHVGIALKELIKTVLIFRVLFSVAYIVSLKFFSREKHIAITYSSGMKNVPIARGIAAMSFRGLEMVPVAVGFAFQMLTAVSFYQLFRKTNELN